MDQQTVAVVGAGVIGIGVAHSLAETGHEVILTDISGEALKMAEEKIRANARLYRLFNKGLKARRPDEVLERIRFSEDYLDLGRAGFVIENVTERWDVKRGVYARLEEVCSKEAIFAANTSAIPITRIASATARPDKVLGIHFMNPVPLKPMVEVIRGYYTSDETLETARRLLAAMGKDCVVVNDSPGFVSNRVLMLTINEAIWLVHDGVASAEDVDRIFKGCFEHKMGPLETADLIGLDTILLSIQVLYESFGDTKYRPCPLLSKMVDARLLGRKSGEGFYQY